MKKDALAENDDDNISML